MKKLSVALVFLLTSTLTLTATSIGQVKVLPMTPATKVLPANIPAELKAQIEAAQAQALGGAHQAPLLPRA